jgi:hypothetical protein
MRLEKSFIEWWRFSWRLFDFVRYWHKADITLGAQNVRYWGVKWTS